MKVAEYIEALRQMPPDAEVVEVWDDGFAHPAKTPKDKSAYSVPGAVAPMWILVKDGAARVVQIS